MDTLSVAFSTICTTSINLLNIQKLTDQPISVVAALLFFS